jgi:hypothetical protein
MKVEWALYKSEKGYHKKKVLLYIGGGHSNTKKLHPHVMFPSFSL